MGSSGLISTSMFALFLNALFLFTKTGRTEQFDSNVERSLKGRKHVGNCNLFQGTWVSNPSYPLYDSSSCPFIDPEFDCIKYGRPDSMFLKYSWKPASCDLARFDGGKFVKQWEGKKIMLVGDSLSLNMWESLLCMIHASVPNAKYTLSRNDPLSFVYFQDYALTVFLYRAPYLVDVVRDRNYGRVLKLDSIQAGNSWIGMDMLIFNSWHWWTNQGQSQPWDYVQYGTRVTKDMKLLDAYKIGLSTWAKWVDDNVDASKTKVFFQGISPTHYMGMDWNEPNKNCKGETQPLPGSTYPAGSPPAAKVVNNVLNTMDKKVYLLDITLLSQLRKDAHPSAYSGDHPGNDCSHWCLPGLPDTWNQLLYSAFNM